jgi:hypothetical protein
VAEHSGIAAESFLRQRSVAVSRDRAAWLAWELMPATLRELSAGFGLTHRESVRKLIRRADRALLGSRLLRSEIEAIRHRLPKTENQPRPREATPLTKGTRHKPRHFSGSGHVKLAGENANGQPPNRQPSQVSCPSSRSIGLAWGRAGCDDGGRPRSQRSTGTSAERTVASACKYPVPARRRRPAANAGTHRAR